jgi:putative ABC transport system substrate-binding protein
LVQLKADVIVTQGTPAAHAAKQATSSIPIVTTTADDPVGSGLVTSLARPGGNITGLTSLAPELSRKRLELLKETVPGISRAAVLWDSAGGAQVTSILRETQVAAQAFGLQLHLLEVQGPNEFESAFSIATKERTEALLVLPSPILTFQRKPLVDLAATSRLPAIYPTREFVDAGGLMAYGPSFPDLFRRAAAYVDKILKGTKPADLPVEQPIKFELLINLKTAKALGLTIPPTLLFQADELIR